MGNDAAADRWARLMALFALRGGSLTQAKAGERALEEIGTSVDPELIAVQNAAPAQRTHAPPASTDFATPAD